MLPGVRPGLHPGWPPGCLLGASWVSQVTIEAFASCLVHFCFLSFIFAACDMSEKSSQVVWLKRIHHLPPRQTVWGPSFGSFGLLLVPKGFPKRLFESLWRHRWKCKNVTLRLLPVLSQGMCPAPLESFSNYFSVQVLSGVISRPSPPLNLFNFFSVQVLF